MSWVAEKNATKRPAPAGSHSEILGSANAKSAIDPISPNWQNKSQPLRWPNFVHRNLIDTQSTAPAHKNFMVYGSVMSVNKPKVALFAPASNSRTCRVANVNKKGSPLDKPSRKMCLSFWLRKKLRMLPIAENVMPLRSTIESNLFCEGLAEGIYSCAR